MILISHMSTHLLHKDFLLHKDDLQRMHRPHKIGAVKKFNLKLLQQNHKHRRDLIYINFLRPQEIIIFSHILHLEP